MLIPKLLPIPFAENGRKNTIPDNRTSEMQAHLASFDTGFPPITMQPKADGGLPPDGMDMNGILYDLSAHAVYQNKGGQYKFDAEYAELIGGYPKGAILLSDDETKQYISVSENNKDNFNDASSANWKVISLADIDVLLNGKVSSQTMADALNLKLDKTTYATLTQQGITQLSTTLSDREDLSATPKMVNDTVLIGEITMWGSNVLPKNYLFCRGQTFTAAQYPQLAKLFPDLKVPDLRGVVPRGLDDARGFDPGRVLGSYQEDATQKIYGTFPTWASGSNFSGVVGAIRVGSSGGDGGSYETYNASIDNSISARTANEERMKNIAINFIIKVG